MIVIDASAVVDYLLHGDLYGRITSRLEAPGGDLHAPHVLDLEVTNALRRLALRRAITAADAESALSDYATLPLQRYPAVAMLTRIWELRSNMTAFDASYVALAEALDAPLLTTDAHLARAPGHHATIELLA